MTESAAGPFAGLRALLQGTAPAVTAPPFTLASLDRFAKMVWERTHGHPDLTPLCDPTTPPEARQRLLDWYTEHNKTCQDPTSPWRHIRAYLAAAPMEEHDSK